MCKQLHKVTDFSFKRYQHYLYSQECAGHTTYNFATGKIMGFFSLILFKKGEVGSCFNRALR